MNIFDFSLAVLLNSIPVEVKTMRSTLSMASERIALGQPIKL
jgi:hypothetical protein